MSTDQRGREQDDTFRADVLERVRVSDIALLLTVPSLLTAIQVLPASVQQSLILTYHNPSAFNLWSAAFVHRGFEHFSNNLGGYCLYIVPSYLLFVLADERRLFRYTFLSFLFILPPVLAVVNIAFFGHGTGAGFSGLASAFVGLLMVAVFVFIRNKVSQEIGPSDGVAVLLVALAGTALIYSSVFTAAGVLVIACLLMVLDIRRLGVDGVRTVVSDLFSMEGYSLLVVGGLALFLASPVLLFPSDIVQGGQPVNILSHFAGFVLGFFGPAALSMYWE